MESTIVVISRSVRQEHRTGNTEEDAIIAQQSGAKKARVILKVAL